MILRSSLSLLLDVQRSLAESLCLASTRAACSLLRATGHCPLVNHQPPQWTIFPTRMRYLCIRDFGGKSVSELIIAGFVTAIGVLSTLRIIKTRRLRKEREERRNKRDAEMRRRMGLDW